MLEFLAISYDNNQLANLKLYHYLESKNFLGVMFKTLLAHFFE